MHPYHVVEVRVPLLDELCAVLEAEPVGTVETELRDTIANPCNLPAKVASLHQRSELGGEEVHNLIFRVEGCDDVHIANCLHCHHARSHLRAYDVS